MTRWSIEMFKKLLSARFEGPERASLAAFAMLLGSALVAVLVLGLAWLL